MSSNWNPTWILARLETEAFSAFEVHFRVLILSATPGGFGTPVLFPFLQAANPKDLFFAEHAGGCFCTKNSGTAVFVTKRTEKPSSKLTVARRKSIFSMATTSGKNERTLFSMAILDCWTKNKAFRMNSASYNCKKADHLCQSRSIPWKSKTITRWVPSPVIRRLISIYRGDTLYFRPWKQEFDYIYNSSPTLKTFRDEHDPFSFLPKAMYPPLIPHLKSTTPSETMRGKTFFFNALSLSRYTPEI